MTEKSLQNLTLLLLYLNGWEEGIETDTGEDLMWAWKSHSLYTMDELEKQYFIINKKKTKSVFLTPEGIKRAKEIEQKLGKILETIDL